MFIRLTLGTCPVHAPWRSRRSLRRVASTRGGTWGSCSAARCCSAWSGSCSAGLGDNDSYRPRSGSPRDSHPRTANDPRLRYGSDAAECAPAPDQTNPAQTPTDRTRRTRLRSLGTLAYYPYPTRLIATHRRMSTWIAHQEFHYCTANFIENHRNMNLYRRRRGQGATATGDRSPFDNRDTTCQDSRQNWKKIMFFL